jgi:hypothetical protein
LDFGGLSYGNSEELNISLSEFMDRAAGEVEEYTLGIPNKEVHDSLLAHFISSCAAYPVSQTLVLGRQSCCRD